LIGQLERFGDCLFVTTVAKQIKKDFPGSHITWAVRPSYKSILELNPFVDEIWEFNEGSREEGWLDFENEALRRQSSGIYDELILTQMIGKNWARFDGTIRSSLLRGYGRPITVPVDPVIRLSESEVEKVKSFALKCNLGSFKNVILFECAPGSGQSSMNVEFALQIAKKTTLKNSDTCFIFSGPKPMGVLSPRIFDASALTFRENAELTKYSTLLVGCSSGITWLCSSDWAKKINTIQLIDENYGIFSGVAYDHELWGLGFDHILEISDKKKESLVEILDVALIKGFSEAKKRYHCIFRPAPNCLKAAVRQLWKHDCRFGSYKKVFFATLQQNKHFNFLPLLGVYIWYFLTDSYTRRIEKYFRKKRNSLKNDQESNNLRDIKREEGLNNV